MTISYAGISHDHRKITLPDSARIYSEELLRFEWYVLLVVTGRTAIRGNIGAQKCEISTMTRPFEIVRVSPEIADRFRRSIDEPHVFGGEIGVKKILITAGCLDDLRDHPILLTRLADLLNFGGDC